MGNRAVIAFTDNDAKKPAVCVYLHWNGGPESVYAILDVMKEGRGMAHSAAYSVARFAHLACELVGHDGHSVGVQPFTNLLEMAGLGEDNGLYVFNISTSRMERYTARGYECTRAVKATQGAVDAEEIAARQHKYWKDDGIRNELRAAIAPKKEGA